MTDERDHLFPEDRPADTEKEDDESRDSGADHLRTSTDEDEANPLTREGPDVPDAADIEDPDEQL